MHLELLSGTLSELRISELEENFLSPHGASDGAYSVQSFTALLNGKRIAGRFSRIWFEDGDQLECAADPQRDGSFAVYAVRRAADQTLWMHPHCSRGSRKHWQFTAKMSVVLALLITIFLLVMLMFHYGFVRIPVIVTADSGLS